MSPTPTVAVAGCGAVVEQYYAPLLREREARGQVQVVGLHDPSAPRMEALRARLPGARACAGLAELLALGADLVIVASPPAAHAAQAVAALEAGSAVLCEKPLAPGAAEAERMVDAAERTGRLLAVALVRRWHASSRLARWAVQSGAFGPVLQVAGFEGGPFRWPVSGPGYFRREVSGGGVLADLGPHLLDLLGDWLGPLELVAAEDDARGGVEANARLSLRAGEVPVALRLSRDWARPEGLEVELARARLRWTPESTEGVTLTPAEGEPMRLSGAGGDFLGSFGAMLDAVLDRVAGGTAPVAEAREAIATVQLIEAAYARRQPMAMPWLEAADGRS